MPSLQLAPGAILDLRYAGRHGLITGSTGSGKTTSILRLASQFHAAGVPVFLPDMKGDVWLGLSGSYVGTNLSPGVNFFLSLARMGADLTARALNLTDAQRGVVDHTLTYETVHGPLKLIEAINKQKNNPSVQVVRRAAQRLPNHFFSPRAFDVGALINNTIPVSVLDCRELVETPVYAVAIVYMLRDLYRRLDERGDGVPVLAFFIDEAHMLFRDIPPALLTELERIVRLIRSKGVSLWFVTQQPADIPDVILAQLQNRVQHSLRAATPADWRGVRTAVDTMPPPAKGSTLDMSVTIGTMAPGEALVSLIGAAGVPQPTRLVRVAAAEWSTSGIYQRDGVFHAIPATRGLGPFEHPEAGEMRRHCTLEGYAQAQMQQAAERDPGGTEEERMAIMLGYSERRFAWLGSAIMWGLAILCVATIAAEISLVVAAMALSAVIFSALGASGGGHRHRRHRMHITKRGFYR